MTEAVIFVAATLTLAIAILATLYGTVQNAPPTVTLDYQFVANPAYNRDRGPVSVFGLRWYSEF